MRRLALWAGYALLALPGLACGLLGAVTYEQRTQLAPITAFTAADQAAIDKIAHDGGGSTPDNVKLALAKEIDFQTVLKNQKDKDGNPAPDRHMNVRLFLDVHDQPVAAATSD